MLNLVQQGGNIGIIANSFGILAEMLKWYTKYLLCYANRYYGNLKLKYIFLVQYAFSCAWCGAEFKYLLNWNYGPPKVREFYWLFIFINFLVQVCWCNVQITILHLFAFVRLSGSWILSTGLVRLFFAACEESDGDCSSLTISGNYFTYRDNHTNSNFGCSPFVLYIQNLTWTDLEMKKPNSDKRNSTFSSAWLHISVSGERSNRV